MVSHVIRILPVDERGINVSKSRMAAVLLRKDDPVRRDAPVDAETRVVPGYCALASRCIRIVALLLEDHIVGEDAEPVREPPRDEELTVVLSCQFHRHMLPESR